MRPSTSQPIRAILGHCLRDAHPQRERRVIKHGGGAARARPKQAGANQSIPNATIEDLHIPAATHFAQVPREIRLQLRNRYGGHDDQYVLFSVTNQLSGLTCENAISRKRSRSHFSIAATRRRPAGLGFGAFTSSVESFDNGRSDPGHGLARSPVPAVQVRRGETVQSSQTHCRVRRIAG